MFFIMRKLISLLLALVMCLSLSVPALAGDLVINRNDATVEDVTPSAPASGGSTAPACTGKGSAANFKVVNPSPARFTDVPAGHWAEESVSLCWKYGLMKGTDAANSKFDLNGSLTFAQALTMACRVHQLYEDGKVTLQNGSPWYLPYFDYAKAHGIVPGFTKSPQQLANISITRQEMAYLFAQALPAKEYAAINSIAYILDVDANGNYVQMSKSSNYYHSTLQLYKAGILVGTGTLGTFGSAYSITRAQAAAIIARVILPQQRIRTEWIELRSLDFLGSNTYTTISQGTPMMTKSDLLDYGIDPALVAQMRDFRTWSAAILATWVEYEPTAAADIHALGADAHLAFVYDHMYAQPAQLNTFVSGFGSLPCLVSTCYGDMDSNGTADLNAAISFVCNGYAVHILYTDMAGDALSRDRISAMCGYTVIGGNSLNANTIF